MRVWKTIIGVISLLTSACSPLSCYECADTFKILWEPLDCQINVSAVPDRVCNEQQEFCFVQRVSVKGIPIRITRDCASECRNGCEATGFGITQITCTSCCNQNKCNIGNGGFTLWHSEARTNLCMALPCWLVSISILKAILFL